MWSKHVGPVRSR